MLSLGWSEPWRMRNLSFMLKADMVIVPKSRRGGEKKREFSVSSVNFVALRKVREEGITSRRGQGWPP